MSIQSEIDRIKGNVASAYSAVDERGGVVPEEQTSDNLAEAVRSVPPAGALPTGCIVIWSGAADAIPDGWALCDGSNGTPDLRDRFVLGASGSYAVGAAGGSEEVTLTVDQIPSHAHGFQATSAVSNGSMDIAFHQAQKVPAVAIGVTTGYTGNSKPHSNMPPYYALCYIMKI